MQFFIVECLYSKIYMKYTLYLNPCDVYQNELNCISTFLKSNIFTVKKILNVENQNLCNKLHQFIVVFCTMSSHIFGGKSAWKTL